LVPGIDQRVRAGIVFAQPLFRCRVRKAVEADLPACDRMCFNVHGLDRSAEVLDAIKEGTATVVEHDDHVTAYATVVGFLGMESRRPITD
jgi:hypothetical protein